MTLKQKIAKGMVGLGLAGVLGGVSGVYYYTPDHIDTPPAVVEYFNLVDRPRNSFPDSESVSTFCGKYNSLMEDQNSAMAIRAYEQEWKGKHEQDKRTLPFFGIVMLSAIAGTAGLIKYQNSKKGN